MKQDTTTVWLRLARQSQLIAFACILASCAPVIGYPHDPEDTEAVSASLASYFKPEADSEYDKLTGDQRQQRRNLIILSRMRAYDIAFDDFQKRLYGDGNAVSVGGDLILLILNGLGATTGSAATKAALAAASTGIVGAQAAISKDLYYQRTIPALLAQMQANRNQIKASILTGLEQPDAKYPLARAELDLEVLKNAGSIPGAIGNITQQAEQQNAEAQAKINSLRSGPISQSNSSLRLRAWLFPTKDAQGNPVLNTANYQAVTKWMQADTADPLLHDLPVETLINGTDGLMELDRVRVLAALHVP